MRIIILLVILMVVQPISTFAITVTDYLIDADIGQYSKSYPGACPKGSGIVAATGHFKTDHTDYACDIRYYNETLDLGVDVQITQHAGSDSDKWLLHEVEDGYRDTSTLSAGLAKSSRLREINGNKIFFYGGGIVAYSWLSNNIVVNIQYANLSGPKPEPLEIVEAYLRKFPSTITLTETEIKSKAHNEKWIKDEMERRLWLCDKWFMALQLGKAKLNKVLKESVDHMNVFLDYREKYYGIIARKEKGALWEYLKAKNGTGIKNKLAEYKSWWEANKDKPINL